MPAASAGSVSPPPLGVGITYSSAIEPPLERRPQLVQVLEIEPQTMWLKILDLQVPHLAKVLEFEQAVMATLADDHVRVVHFDFEPMPLLRALAEGRRPDGPLQPGNFGIELTPDGPRGVDGVEFDDLEEEFPSH
jgi:uncharacterized protein